MVVIAVQWILVVLLQGSHSSLAFSSQSLLGRVNPLRVGPPLGLPRGASNHRFFPRQKSLPPAFQLGASSFGNEIESTVEDLKKGALHVHDNFWGLFWYIVGLALCIYFGSFAVTWFLYTVSPSFAVKLVSALNKGVLGVANTVALWDPMDLAGMTGVMNEMGALAGPLLVTPILEEVYYRKFILTLLQKLIKRITRNKSAGLEEKRQDFSLWAIRLSSAMFAASRLSKFVGPLEATKGLLTTDGLESLIQAFVVGIGAILQCVVAFVLSIRVYTPLFAETGLAASIGAHAVWKASTLTCSIGIPIRALGRLWKWSKTKMKKSSS